VFRFTQAWLWHMVAGSLFSDDSRNITSWLVSLILCLESEAIATYSWGSAALAWLYCSLCDEVTRSGLSSNLWGCAYLLQIWYVLSSFLLYILYVNCLANNLDLICSRGHLTTTTPHRGPYWVIDGRRWCTSQAPLKGATWHTPMRLIASPPNRYDNIYLHVEYLVILRSVKKFQICRLLGSHTRPTRSMVWPSMIFAGTTRTYGRSLSLLFATM
jgi:hypothetical protein